MMRWLGWAALLTSACGGGNRGYAPAEDIKPPLLGGMPVSIDSVPVPTFNQAFVLRESGIRSPRRVIVRDSAEWTVLWNEIRGDYRGDGRGIPPPRIDFHREMLAVAALGTSMPMGEHFPAIISAALRGDTLLIVVRDYFCEPNHPNDGSDAPVALARLPKRGPPVAFVENSVSGRCE